MVSTELLSVEYPFCCRGLHTNEQVFELYFNLTSEQLVDSKYTVG